MGLLSVLNNELDSKEVGYTVERRRRPGYVYTQLVYRTTHFRPYVKSRVSERQDHRNTSHGVLFDV